MGEPFKLECSGNHLSSFCSESRLPQPCISMTAKDLVVSSTSGLEINFTLPLTQMTGLRELCRGKETVPGKLHHSTGKTQGTWCA